MCSVPSSIVKTHANAAPTSGLTLSSANWKTSSGRFAVWKACAISRTAVSSRRPKSVDSVDARARSGFGLVDIGLVIERKLQLLFPVRNGQGADFYAVEEDVGRRVDHRGDGVGHVLRVELPGLIAPSA